MNITGTKCGVCGAENILVWWIKFIHKWVCLECIEHEETYPVQLAED